MSLVALKRKADAKSGLSRGKQGFSTVGTVRTRHRIGVHQRNSSVRTIMKGTTARGHGGSSGTYHRASLSNGKVCTSTATAPQCCLNTSAYHSLKTCAPQWYTDTQVLGYVDLLARLRVDNLCETTLPELEADGYCCENTRIGSKIVNRNTYYHSEPGAIPAGEYTGTMLLKNKCLPPACERPFAPCGKATTGSIYDINPYK